MSRRYVITRAARLVDRGTSHGGRSSPLAGMEGTRAEQSRAHRSPLRSIVGVQRERHLSPIAQTQNVVNSDSGEGHLRVWSTTLTTTTSPCFRRHWGPYSTPQVTVYTSWRERGKWQARQAAGNQAYAFLSMRTDAA